MILQRRSHNPYFNRWFSAINAIDIETTTDEAVTILILIDGFLQYEATIDEFINMIGHNPYFNRWFSAMKS